MKKIILFVLIIAIKLGNVYCQEYHNCELLIWNESVTNTKILATIYPVSMMINGFNTCDLVAWTRGSSGGHTSYYINGVEYYLSDKKTSWELRPGDILYFDMDLNSEYEDPPLISNGKLGYGIYKIVIQTLEPAVYPEHLDSLTIDIDASNDLGDQCIRFRDNSNDPRTLFQYQFELPPKWIRITPANYQMKPWVHYNRVRLYGDAYFAPYDNLTLPLDSRKDCNRVLSPPFDPAYQNQNQAPYNGDARSGNLTLNLMLYGPDVFTPVQDQRINFPTYINILSYPGDIGPTLTLYTGTFLDLKYDTWYTPQNYRFTVLNNYNKMVIQQDALLRIENKNKYFMHDGSTLQLYPSNYPDVEVMAGGTFCNYGGHIFGGGRIRFYGAVMCSDWQDFFVQDSTQIELADSASWQLEPNSTVTLDGPVTCLKMSPNSEIKFGANSKLILQNGARLIADHAKFTSLDPNTTWDGIYLSDISNDTITNCTIENAVNGINITDKNYSMYASPSTEINNCTLSNTTNTQLTSGVYVNNSTNVLIKGNNFTSTQLAQGFANGVMIEYCPAGSPLVVDNNIDKVLTGIFVSQSSPYIAGNMIIGVTESGKGIVLDNSNGTVEYNIINNFVNSYTTSYSSPYLLKNTFNNASETNVDLWTSSIPVIRPVNSGTLLRWLSGNNTVSGSPSNAGISYNEESYPVIDSGFNKIMVGESNYMSGVIPSNLDGELNAIMNYWVDNPPVSQQMAVTGGEVQYDPTFDGSSLPATDYTELNEIGFGLYDTVFVETLGGDTPSPENLFSQAYQNEIAHQYIQAITLYKQVITNYRTSSYAALSLSRIFNCLEKKIGTNIDYQQLQTYMNQLRTNNLYPAELREIAEDFIIKSKVKQGMLQSAINDYQTMYEQNQNNHKGIHALINKEILITMLNDTGDAPKGGTNIQKLANHKLRLLSIITGREFTPLKVSNNNQIPHSYMLYQNYPNPFNPKTTIKYDLPKDGFVTFKVYDILGKELLSLNEFKQAGTYQIALDGSNYASGLYFYRLESGSYVETKKMVLVK